MTKTSDPTTPKSARRKAAEPKRTVAPEPIAPVSLAQSTPSRLMQINFSCSEGLVRLIDSLRSEQGSTRVVIARALKAAGYSVPPEDLELARTSKRRF